MSNRWTEGTAVAALKRNRVRIDGKLIDVGSRRLGIKLLGAVDFLVGRCGYDVGRVADAVQDPIGKLLTAVARRARLALLKMVLEDKCRQIAASGGKHVVRENS